MQSAFLAAIDLTEPGHAVGSLLYMYAADMPRCRRSHSFARELLERVATQTGRDELHRPIGLYSQ